MSLWARPYFERVLVLLGGDVAKTHRWYVVPNPHLGWWSPVQMIAGGRESVLEKMIALAEHAASIGTRSRAFWENWTEEDIAQEVPWPERVE